MQPENAPQTNTIALSRVKKIPRQRHFLAVFFISFIWGMVGADRMYLGKWGTGIAKLLTLGGFGLWGIVDIILILTGAMRDKQGRTMLQYEEYKAFAYKTILIFAIATGVVVLINGLFLITVVTQFMVDMQSGGGLPGMDLLNGLNGTGLTPEQMQEFGL